MNQPLRRSTQSGAVLIIVMMVMLGLLGLGLTALWLTSGNLQVGAAMNQRTQALYAAEAGVERARGILNSPTVTATDINAELAGTCTTLALDNIPNALDSSGMPNGVGAVMSDPAITAGSPCLANIPFPASSVGRTKGTVQNPTVDTMGTYTVWIRNDTAECREAALGGAFASLWTTDSNGSVVVRSRGLASDGRTTVILDVSLGAIPGGPNAPGGGTPNTQVLCNAGKNACDDNNSVLSGIVAN